MMDALMAILVFGLALVTPIAVIVLIVKLVTAKKDDENGMVSFEKGVRSFYVYAILVVAFCMLVLGAIGAFSAGLDILLPEVADVTSRIYVNELNESKIEFAEAVGVLVTAIPLFVYHSKVAKSIDKRKK